MTIVVAKLTTPLLVEYYDVPCTGSALQPEVESPRVYLINPLPNGSGLYQPPPGDVPEQIGQIGAPNSYLWFYLSTV